jgi:hypothetical protein
MNKTKVKVSSFLLDYQITTAQWVAECREEKLKYAAQVEDDLEPFTGAMDIYAPETPGLLTPPWIETLLPVFYFLEDGEVEGIINISTSDLFGIEQISVTLWDEAGNLLEKGYAELNEGCIGCWAYPVQKSMAPAVGTTVIVRAVAIDPLGGMSIAEEKLTLTEEYLRASTDDLEWRMNQNR